MPGIDDFLRVLGERVAALVTDTFKKHVDAARRDAEAFLAATRADLERWGQLLAAGELTPDDFQWLVKGRVDVAKMAALKQAGLAKARLDGFKRALLATVVGTARELLGV